MKNCLNHRLVSGLPDQICEKDHENYNRTKSKVGALLKCLGLVKAKAKSICKTKETFDTWLQNHQEYFPDIQDYVQHGAVFDQENSYSSDSESETEIESNNYDAMLRTATEPLLKRNRLSMDVELDSDDEEILSLNKRSNYAVKGIKLREKQQK